VITKEESSNTKLSVFKLVFIPTIIFGQGRDGHFRIVYYSRIIPE